MFGFSYKINPIQAQISSDETLSTQVTTSDNLNYLINGGNRAGNNLFHSFKEFSIPTQGSAIFNHSSDVQNIISRVTGNSLTTIDGLIQTSGNTNLFLINPKGIIFNANAQLNIGGSFIASTASGIRFADGHFFSATAVQQEPLLTMSVPIGLQFGQTVGQIDVTDNNQINVNNQFNFQLKPNKTLALVGGNINIKESAIIAPQGSIELGGVGANSFVSLKPMSQGWEFSYDNIEQFQDVILSNSFVSTNDIFQQISGGGFINIYAENIFISGSGIFTVSTTESISADSSFNTLDGTISINANDFIEITQSILSSTSISDKRAGDIIINTKKLLVQEQTEILASTQSQGDGGNIMIHATESMEVNGGLAPTITRVSTQSSSLSQGNAGDLIITTKKLIVGQGGQISSSTFGQGNGGDLMIKGAELVELTGKNTNTDIFSALLATNENGEFSKSGNITIVTDKLKIADEARINVRGKEEGAGNIEVIANNIELDNQGQIIAESTSGNGGNINLNIKDKLIMGNGSNISTNAGTEGSLGDGGNIIINARDGIIFAVPANSLMEDSNITANAFSGSGGRVDINALGILGIQAQEQDIQGRNDITASSELGTDGVVNTDVTMRNIDNVRSPIEVTKTKVAQVCKLNRNGEESEFTIVGRGGLPTNPQEMLNNDAVEVNWISFNREDKPYFNSTKIPNSQPQKSAVIVEATGWNINSQGQIVLSVNSENLKTDDGTFLWPVSCDRL